MRKWQSDPIDHALENNVLKTIGNDAMTLTVVCSVLDTSLRVCKLSFP